MASTATIKVTDNRHGNTFRTGVNGRIYEIPLNQEVKVDSGLVDHLEGLGVAFEKVSSKGASASKEGSGEVLAPISAPTGGVRAPAMDAKSVGDRENMGDQPGDPTPAGDTGKGSDDIASIETDAKHADEAVMAELKDKQNAVPMKIVGADSPAPATDSKTAKKK